MPWWHRWLHCECCIPTSPAAVATCVHNTVQCLICSLNIVPYDDGKKSSSDRFVWIADVDPIAWLLYGQVGSQLGNVDTTIQLVRLSVTWFRTARADDAHCTCAWLHLVLLWQLMYVMPSADGSSQLATDLPVGLRA